ncbi:MAG: HIT family protein [Bdellovibrionales bacterium]|nr:HIT family protein [Bdellovibrionales bacterium]
MTFKSLKQFLNIKMRMTGLYQYGSRDHDCPFCKLTKKRILWKSPLLMEVKDIYPVSKNHTLLITKRHVASAEDCTAAELRAIILRSKITMKSLRKLDKKITGFNLGFNVGESAGQTVPHVHFHIIPRRAGDHSNPRGGIRAVIPGKAVY